MRIFRLMDSGATRFYLVFFVLVSIGAYLRLDQFTLQVLLDDEWHAVHQLLVKTPGELFQSVGHADFSIPLALMYWSELKLTGLSEMGMRWPMMLAGIATLVVLPLYVRKFFGDRATLIFTILLAISPLLIIYSRTARPYALTLLLSLLSLAAFDRYTTTVKSPWKPGLLYCASAILSSWLHMITLPIVVAPFITRGIPVLLAKDWRGVRRIFWLGLGTFAGLLALILPPLLTHPQALGARLGFQTPDLQTYYGALYAWLGTPSSGLVAVMILLAVAGAGRLWWRLPFVSSLVAGLGLSLIVILLTRPAWVQNPLTLARYLLPVIPLVLLSTSLGVIRLTDTLVYYWGREGKLASGVVVLSGLLLTIYYSPLAKLLAQPNSNSLHSVYQFDFREEQNLPFQYQKDFPVSPFWQQLASLPRDSLKVTASPFSFETHHWDAARWEQISRQRVMPGYLNGLCTEHRWGEVPAENGFEFKNVGYLTDTDDLVRRGFDLVVYQKPFRIITNQGEKELGNDTITCAKALQEQLPEPVYEDRWLVVFPLSDRVRSQVDAQR